MWEGWHTRTTKKSNVCVNAMRSSDDVKSDEGCVAKGSRKGIREPVVHVGRKDAKI